MIKVERDAVELARVNMEKAREKYMRLRTRDARYRFLEASRAYRTILRVNYNL